MEVKEGFKQTEAGLIPEGWAYEPLRTHTISSAYGPRFSGKHYDERGNVALLRTTDLDDEGNLIFAQMPRAKLPLDQFKSHVLLPGDFLVTRSGTCGLATVFLGFEIPVLPGAFLIRLRFTTVVCAGFLKIYFNSEYGKRHLQRLTEGGVQKNIRGSALVDLSVPIPPLPEQRAIAAALSDVDALLEGLDRLIAKKRDLKQAAMQQLLSGHIRLPGFSGEWDVKRLGDHVTFLRNGVHSRAELRPEGRVKYLHYGDIHASVGAFLLPNTLPSLQDAKAARLDRLRDGDVIFADASEDIAGVCKSVELRDTRDTEVVSGLHTIAARFDKTVLADGFKGFLQYCPTFATHLRRHAAGTKVLATNRAHIASVEMRLPDVVEQEAIAAVLSDMDAELAALEARREKTRALKQGMMQELLTGRIRLVESGPRASEQPARQADGQQANIHFKRSVLAAEIIDRLHGEPTFGHVKFEKVMFLVEHLCAVDTGSTYLRKAAGPYDNRALRSIDSQLRKQQWFDCRKEGERYRYMPMEHRGGHKRYFERYFADITDTFENVLQTFKTLETERCEIVATLLSAWGDLLQAEGDVSDERIVHEVLNNWHKSKERIPKDRWLKALEWMRSRGFVPREGA